MFIISFDDANGIEMTGISFNIVVGLGDMRKNYFCFFCGWFAVFAEKNNISVFFLADLQYAVLSLYLVFGLNKYSECYYHVGIY